MNIQSKLGMNEHNRCLFEPPGHDNPIFKGRASKLVLLTHDMNFVCQYISESAQSVTGLPRSQWIGKRLDQQLTTNHWNTCLLRQSIESLVPDQNQVVRCEVYDENRSPVQLELERHLIVHDRETIGVVAIGRRLPTVNDMLANISVLKDPLHVGPNLSHRWAALNEGEIDVIELLVQGLTNRSIAKRLGVSERTIEARRSKAMKKLAARSVSELTRIHLLVQSQKSISLSA